MPVQPSYPIIVHNAGHVRAVLTAASELGCKATLQTAPDALAYAGILYVKTMFEQAKTTFPDVQACYIIDCTDSRALAIEAMQAGISHIRSSAAPEIQEKLASIAQQNDVTLYTGPYEALDLQAIRVTKEAIKEWLART